MAKIIPEKHPANREQTNVQIIKESKLLCGYFLPSVIGYVVGLIATMLALTVMHSGQPALL